MMIESLKSEKKRKKPLYSRERPATFFTMILSGKIEIFSGRDEVRVEFGAFQHLGEGCLKVPPDGKCILYAYMAAQSPDHWLQVPRHPSGHIKDPAMERLLADEARRHLGSI